MNQYLLESYGNRVAVSQNDIAEAVAHEYDVDTGFVNNTGGRVIVRCQTYEPFAALFARLQRRCTDLFRPFWFQIGHFQLSLHHDLWTIGLPVERGVWKFCGRTNK